MLEMDGNVVFADQGVTVSLLVTTLANVQDDMQAFQQAPVRKRSSRFLTFDLCRPSPKPTV